MRNADDDTVADILRVADNVLEVTAREAILALATDMAMRGVSCETQIRVLARVIVYAE